MPDLPRVVIVGAGSIGERHLRCFLETGRAAVDFVEPRDDLRGQIAARYSRATAFRDLESALVHPADCAVIATPAPLHIPQAIFALEQSCHVLIEKPLSVATEGVDRLADLAAAREQVAAVAYVYRAHPSLREMRDVIAAGRFGRPLELVAVSGQHFPFYRPAYAQTYYADIASGGGAVQDALTHILNAGQWLVGKVDAVVADAAHLKLRDVEVEDTVHVLARHGKVLASYALNQHQAPNESTITLICESGTARCEFHKNRWLSVAEPGEPWEEHPAGPLERDALFILQAGAFLDSCFDNAPPLCPLSEGIASFRANLAILESLATRSWQPVESDGR